MRVVCIDENFFMPKCMTAIPVKKGNVYSVMDSRNDPGRLYVLQGVRFLSDPGIYYKFVETGAYWFHSSKFLPLNEDQQDETEMHRNYSTIIASSDRTDKGEFVIVEGDK